jgi:hypothetical protein
VSAVPDRLGDFVQAALFFGQTPRLGFALVQSLSPAQKPRGISLNLAPLPIICCDSLNYLFDSEIENFAGRFMIKLDSKGAIHPAEIKRITNGIDIGTECALNSLRHRHDHSPSLISWLLPGYWSSLRSPASCALPLNAIHALRTV